MSEPMVKYSMGTDSAISINRGNCTAQHDRIEDMQFALSRAREVMRVLQLDDLPEQSARAIAFFAEIGLEHIVESVGEQAVNYAFDQQQKVHANLDVAQAQIDAWNADEERKAAKKEEQAQ